MNGWATDIVVWEESGILGAQTGTAYSPPGIVQINIQPRVIQRWTTIDPLRALKSEAALQTAWSITLSRQFDKSAFSDFWLSSITDASPTTAGDSVYRQLIDNPTPRTFGLEFVMEDGSQRRYTGCAVEKIEYNLASGRIVQEEVTLTVLLSAAFTGDVRTHTSEAHTVHTGLNAFFNLRTGTAWGMDHATDRQTTFSSQLIFQREMEPTQFNHVGNPTRFSVSTGWEFLGRVVTRSPALWSALHNTTPCVAEWNFGNAANFVNFQAHVNARLSGQTVLVDGQIDSNIDFQAYRFGRSLFDLEIHAEA